MQRVVPLFLQMARRTGVRYISAHNPPSSFNPEAYLAFPQFLHDINNKLTIYKKTEGPDVFTKGRLVYTNQCVTMERQDPSVLEVLSSENRIDLKQLNVACKGLFWQSEIDYTIVPCAFHLDGEFTQLKFLEGLGLNSALFNASIKFTYCDRGTLTKLPMVSYLGEDEMNVYRSARDMIHAVLDKYDDVYHITIGEGIINPLLQFIVAKTEGNSLIGIMSASIET